MAYTGGIRYLSVPGPAKWEQDIISPWKAANNNTGSLVMEVLVRDITDIKQGALFLMDILDSSLDQHFKYVLVGSSKSTPHSGREYYALIVAPLEQQDTNMYKRVGVASMYEQQIGVSGSGTKGYIC
jgi:hypothetical protein